MIDIQTLGLISFVVRIVGSFFFGIVLYTQIKLRFRNDQQDLNGYRNLLIILTTFPFFFNFVALYNNYIRFIDDSQSEIVNNFSFVLGAVSSTAVAVVLWLLYKKR